VRLPSADHLARIAGFTRPPAPEPNAEEVLAIASATNVGALGVVESASPGDVGRWKHPHAPPTSVAGDLGSARDADQVQSPRRGDEFDANDRTVGPDVDDPTVAKLLLAHSGARREPADVSLERVSLADGPSAVLRRVRDVEVPSPYAITAEAATEQIAPRARFSRVEIYVDDPDAWDRALSLTLVPRGGNVVLIRPVDRGVFDGAFEREGLLLASRPQLYVDLVRRGGAAAEAAAFIRERSALWQP
jgi:hypothetical protein